MDTGTLPQQPRGHNVSEGKTPPLYELPSASPDKNSTPWSRDAAEPDSFPTRLARPATSSPSTLDPQDLGTLDDVAPWDVKIDENKDDAPKAPPNPLRSPLLSTKRLSIEANAFLCPRCDREKSQIGALCPEHGLFLVPAAEKIHAKPGSALGRLLHGKYAVLGLLGSGGMGTVYWGIQHPIGRKVAIKVLRKDLTQGHSAEERFVREAQAVSSILHPHLITCYDYGVENDHLAYMVLEYIEGQSLRKYMSRACFDLDMIYHLGQQILEALSEIHAANVIHRDLKPSNIMLCKVGHNDHFVKIIDFGLALFTDAQSRLTLAGEVFGTPRYMSPEQAAGEFHIGPTTDIYALGTILYEMVCGDTPFQGSPLSVIRKQNTDPIPQIVLRPGLKNCPKPLKKFIYRCLSKKPELRFFNGERALEAFVKCRRKSE